VSLLLSVSGRCLSYATAETDLAEEREPVDPSPGPSQGAVLKELWHKVRQRLSPEEQQLVDLRVAGHSWVEIATAVGKCAAGLRMRYTRARARITNRLGLQP
jgi:DNA-directed RNA polymerase specialized sigma24 family protein